MRLKRLQAEVQAERDALLDSQRQKEQLFEFIVHDLHDHLAGRHRLHDGNADRLLLHAIGEGARDVEREIGRWRRLRMILTRARY